MSLHILPNRATSGHPRPPCMRRTTPPTVRPISICTTDGYDPIKSIHTLLYVVQRCGKRIEIARLLTMLYLSDKVHLRRYGRFICGDSYLALRSGPVPYALFQTLRTVRDAPTDDSDQLLAFQVTGRFVTPRFSANLDLFSISDRECLDTVIATGRHLPLTTLQRRSRDTAFRRAPATDEMSIDMIALTLPNAQAILDYLHHRY